MQTFHPAPPDGFVIWVTRIYWLIAAYLAVVAFGSSLFGAGWAPLALSWVRFLAAALLAVGAVTWAVQPRVYRLTAAELLIERQAWAPPARVPLASLTGARPYELPWHAVRLFGNGGVFAITGWFWTRETGTFWIAATRRSGLVLLEGPRKVALSPENPALFLEALAAAGIPPGEPPVAEAEV